LGGHDHFGFIEINNTHNTLIVKAGSDAKYVGKMSLVLEKTEKGGDQFESKVFIDNVGLIMNRYKNEASPHEDDESDIEMRNMIDYLNAQLPPDAYDILATCETSLNSATSHCRFRESTFGNMLCDVLKDAFQADLTIFNGGGIRADKVYPVDHPLRVIDVMREFPLPNEMLCVDMKGKYIKKFLELCIAPMDVNGEYGSGLYPQVSHGVNIVFDRKREVGHRIVSMYLNDQPLNEDEYYRVATTNYLLEGGLDGSNWLKQYTYDNADRIHINTSQDYYRKGLVDIMKCELPKIKVVRAEIEGRTVDVNDLEKH